MNKVQGRCVSVNIFNVNIEVNVNVSVNTNDVSSQ